ncbi:efflux RND transporter periplasmic adaptor subunit [Chelativorans intermedius]|uniref:Efflux RND transporter periplasmic adaptor subunit n=1 Tax=Chelativorans intermedius TaxID=515947 RepID=A0ABV6D9M8_9HYPH|nr:efflux RND transporter periplasmic adaptor subunit [Chelativorans intermedius]MCT8998549.1 efflux RND transporter periplasmic adaptor subunit [Chelativorans intermedius]
MIRKNIPVFALLAFGLAGVFHAAHAAAGEFAVKSTAIPEMKAVFGQVQSRTVVPARARRGGTVRQVDVTEGSEVRQGQIIATVVDEKIALELDAAEARIQELLSQLANARTELERAEQLFARGVVSQGRVDQARTQFDVATNQLAAAEANKAVIEQQAREGEVLAPATGRVLTVPVTPGSVVLPGETIARIATGQYYLRLSLPERHAAQIREGSTVRLGQRGLRGSAMVETELEGRIAKVYPEIADGRVIADVEVAELGDYFVNERTLVWIPVGSRDVLSVPPEAVTTRHGIDYVSLLTADGPIEIAVILGERFVHADAERIEILSGLRAGDKVLLP